VFAPAKGYWQEQPASGRTAASSWKTYRPGSRCCSRRPLAPASPNGLPVLKPSYV